jgi:hypothetical protein
MINNIFSCIKQHQQQQKNHIKQISIKQKEIANCYIILIKDTSEMAWINYN